MKARSLLVVAAAALVAVVTPAFADSLPAAPAVPQIALFGTLCVGTPDSFDCQAAPLFTRLAVVRQQATAALKKHEITSAEAVQIQAKANAVRKLLDPAVKLCAVSGKTGECNPAHAVQAHYLLSRAQTAIADLGK